MLCFITALKSKAVSNNWGRVSELFENAVYSAYNQIDPDIKIIAVCHETPGLKRKYDGRLEIINVDFPPPAKTVTEVTMRDKWKKIAVGMVRAGRMRPGFVMIMDADDLVSRQLSQYANSHKESNGWIFEKGYRYRYGHRRIYFDNSYNCGTNAIINARLIKFPENADKKNVAECIVLTHGHTNIKEGLARLKAPLEPLPFIGSMYTHGHGDNDHPEEPKKWHGARYFLGSLKHYRLLTGKIREEFSIEQLQRARN